MATHNLFHMDVMKWADEYTGPKFHALLCDPPYHLMSIVDRFGGPEAKPAKFGTDGVFQRASGGFMNAAWDGETEHGAIAFNPATWRALARHLYPGAFILAFASSRGAHRMAVAMEDAGLIINPTFYNRTTGEWMTTQDLGWAFGSGFPKATRLDTAIDRRAGAERRVTGTRKHQPKFDAAELGYRAKDNGFNSHERVSFETTAPATSLAAAWEGHRYGGQAIKPALEPIIVAQVPYLDGPALDSILATGAGAWNIDAGRIGTDEKLPQSHHTTMGYGGCATDFVSGGHPAGRWPAHFLLQHAVECNEAACVPGCPIPALDAQSGHSASRATGYDWNRSSNGNPTNIVTNIKSGVHFDDSGGASRYFFQSDWAAEVAERLATIDPAIYSPKCGSAERDAGLPPAEDDKRANTHPTLKPLRLTKYLASLLLPPEHVGERRILVPFAGSGSEGIGAMKAGWDHVSMVEMTDEYIPINRARWAYWEQNDLPPPLPRRGGEEEAADPQLAFDL